jgi:glycosyltransferase involved in cell wall biosynthesis
MLPIKNRDIIIVGQQPWDVEIGSNCKNIALEFSKHNRVLYVNSALDRISFLKHRKDEKILKRINVIRGKESSLISIQNNLWNLFPDCMLESINWIKSQSIFEYFNLINNKRFASSIQKAIHHLNFKNVILFNDNDMFRSFHLKELLQPAISIYYSRDYMLAVDYWKLHGTKLEPMLIAKSNLCVANSTYLSNYCKQYNKHSYYVGQGCDLSMFSNIQNTVTPPDFEHLSKPIIGYVGALQSLRLDISLLKYLAETKPEWNIVLVGPEDEIFKNSSLHNFSNILFTGAKDSSQLGNYINAFDVCINPQLISEVTIGNYPRKIDEYLAVGKPVVATKTEAMNIFSNYTYLASSKEEYVLLIEKALQENNVNKMNERKAFAATHTWENSVQEIYNAIEFIK